MRVQYLGTGAAEGIPASFCNCAFCKYARANGVMRTRAQVLLDGELSIDFPPDAFLHAARGDADFSAIKYLLVTHSHMDHFYAHDFILRGYKYAYEIKEPVLHIFGNEEVLSVFGECTRRELKPQVQEGIRLHPVRPFEEFCFGEWRVFPFPAQHTSESPLLYLIERGDRRVLHLTDTGYLPEQSFRYLASCGGAPLDLITFDCTFLFESAGPNARHMGLEENKRVFARLAELKLADAHTKKVITHFSHNCFPDPVRLGRAEREFGCKAAFDGMQIEI